MTKKTLTSEQIYQKNKRKAKLCKIFTPIIFYMFFLLTIFFLILAMKHSIGNVFDILNLLDKDVYSGEELRQNYMYLVEKWGEWEIIGEDSAGFVVRYVNIGNALFSGLMMTYFVLASISLTLAIVFGKIIDLIL